MKKKLLAILIGLCMVFAFAACGDSSSSSQDSTEATEETTVEETTTTEETTEATEATEPFNKDDCEEVSYEELARNPDKHEGEAIKITGNVLQAMDDSETGLVSLRVATSGSYDDVVYVIYNSDIMESRVLEDDNITVYGTSTGIYSYESSGAGTISIPSMVGMEVNIN